MFDRSCPQIDSMQKILKIKKKMENQQVGFGIHEDFRETQTCRSKVETSKKTEDNYNSLPLNTSWEDLLRASGNDLQIQRIDTNSRRVVGRATIPEIREEATSAQHQHEILHFLKNLPSPEMVEKWMISQKEKGNQLYAARNFSQAMQQYEDCLLGLNFLPATGGHTEKLKLPVILNLAACMMEVREHRRCIALCTIALEIVPRHLRATFRRAVANYRSGNLCNAQKDFQTAQKVCLERKLMNSQNLIAKNQQTPKENKVYPERHANNNRPLDRTNSTEKEKETEQQNEMDSNEKDNNRVNTPNTEQQKNEKASCEEDDILRRCEIYLKGILQQRQAYRQTCKRMMKLEKQDTKQIEAASFAISNDNDQIDQTTSCTRKKNGDDQAKNKHYSSSPLPQKKSSPSSLMFLVLPFWFYSFILKTTTRMTSLLRGFLQNF